MSFTLTMLVFLTLRFIQAVGGEPSLSRSCEPIRVEMCQNLGYNMTGMPNLSGNDLQQEANYCLKTFDPLIQYGCSEHLRLFLCSVYVPMCTEKVDKAIGPCRGLCEHVHSKCIPVLENFGFSWPESLNCSRFPIENNHEHMCMEGPKEAISAATAVDGSVDGKPSKASSKMNCGTSTLTNGDDCILFGGGCNGEHLFNAAEKKFAEVWISAWAFVCLASSLGAALTICIGGGRVRAKPLVSLSLCYCFVSLGWAMRMLSGRMATTCVDSATQEQPADGLNNANCAFVFLLIYYFGMASNAWWVCLCACWFAKAGLSLSTKNLKNFNSLLHVTAWGLPAAQTVVALVRRDVDTDPLTGTCYVGNRNDVTLLTLVLVPQAVYLTLGVVLLILGSVYVIRRPPLPVAIPLTGSSTTAPSATAPRKNKNNSDVLGALSTLYVIPTACVFASYCYEYNNRDEWMRSGVERPALWAFLLRYLMSFFVGVSMIFYVWSSKSWTAWKSVFKRFEHRKQQQQQQQLQQQPPLPTSLSAVKCQSLSSVVRYGPGNGHSHVTTQIGGNVSANGSSSGRHSTRSYPHRKLKLNHHGSSNIGGRTLSSRSGENIV